MVKSPWKSGFTPLEDKEKKNQLWKENISLTGFTLLEVLLGVVIFSLIIGAVYSTFRAGLQMYKVGSTEKQLFQEARTLTDFTQRDLRSIPGIDETSYDIPPIQPDTTGEMDYSTDTSWVPDETSYSIAPYPFYGTTTSLSLYTFEEVPLGTVKGMREGIFHVDYTYTNNVLFRNANEITGNTFSSISESEDLVHHVLSCEFNYGYWKDNKWYWVDTWDSRRDSYRNQKSDQDAESLLDISRVNYVHVYPDNLPDAVKIKLLLQEVDNPKSPGREFEWISEIPSSKPELSRNTND